MKNLKTFAKYFIVCGGFAVLVGLSSCEKAEQKRTYEEVVTQPPPDPQKLLQEMIARGEDPHAFLNTHPMNEENVSKDTHAPVTWKVPGGWKEKTAGGMRLASFISETDPHLDVSIVSLSGEAGGISANINRWLGQLHLPVFDDATLQPFLSKQEKFFSDGGLLVTLVDFSALLPKDDQSLPGMLAAIVELSDQTVFVKMTGTIGEINKNRELFRKLCQSLK